MQPPPPDVVMGDPYMGPPPYQQPYPYGNGYGEYGGPAYVNPQPIRRWTDKW